MIEFDRGLTDEEAKEIEGLAADGVKFASLSQSQDAFHQVADLQKFYQSLGALPKDQWSRLAFILGSLYGTLVTKEYGWRWAQVKFEDGEKRYAVVSPDQKFCILAHENFYAALSGTKKLNLALLFGLLKTKLPPPPISSGLFPLS